MLKANVGLSRKVSKDYNSTGYSVNLDGEITAPVSDPEAVIEQVKELFDLAEEALSQQIERSQSDAAIAGHDESPQPLVQAGRNGNGTSGTAANHRTNGTAATQRQNPPSSTGNGADDPPATNKQVQYLLSIAKRQRLSTVQLEKKIAEILGRAVGLYDLTKNAAGTVIEALTNGASANGSRVR